MKKHALIIGVEKYLDKMITPLEYACDDAMALAQRLTDRCGFDNVHLMVDGNGENDPQLRNILAVLGAITPHLNPDDLFLFFFAGHGVEKDGRSYLLVRDTTKAYCEHGSLSLELLRKNFEHLDAGKRLLIIDACRKSPDAGRGDADNHMADAVARDMAAIAHASLSGTASTALFSACKSGQRAYEWADKKHGVFTHFLLEGIDGAAWENDTLDFKKLAKYTSSHVRQWVSRTAGLHTQQDTWYEEVGDPETFLLAAATDISPVPKFVPPKVANVVAPGLFPSAAPVNAAATDISPVPKFMPPKVVDVVAPGLFPSVAPVNEETGLFIDSDPQGADIFLNGKATQKKTPFLFPNLRNAMYEIELLLNGYDLAKESAYHRRGEMEKVFVTMKEKMGTLRAEDEEDAAEEESAIIALIKQNQIEQKKKVLAKEETRNDTPLPPATKSSTNNSAVASLVLGICSIPSLFVGVVLGPLAILYAEEGIRQFRMEGIGNWRTAMAGRITGILGIMVGIVSFICLINTRVGIFIGICALVVSFFVFWGLAASFDEPEIQHVGVTTTKPHRNNSAITSLILGIASILCLPLGVVLGTMAIWYASRGLNNIATCGIGRRMSLAGRVTGIIGTILGTISIICLLNPKIGGYVIGIIVVAVAVPVGIVVAIFVFYLVIVFIRACANG